MSERSKAFFNEATKRLQLAKDENFKPFEDFVSYSVCKNSQRAIEGYLKGYLIEKGEEIELKDTIATLYDKCIAIDGNFKKIHLKDIRCKKEGIDARYCSDLSTVTKCSETAESIDNFLKNMGLL